MSNRAKLSHPALYSINGFFCELSILDSLCGCSISNQVATHVLHDLLTVVVLVTTRVLVGPLESEDGASVVVETAHVVASAVVILRVEQSGGGEREKL